MGTWNTLSSIVAVLSGCGTVLLALGCCWPSGDTPHPGRSHQKERRPSVPPLVRPPTQFTCTAPGPPVTLAEAHTWMQIHRDHDCPRKQAAFAALVAAGRIHPDSTRRNTLRSEQNE